MKNLVISLAIASALILLTQAMLIAAQGPAVVTEFADPTVDVASIRLINNAPNFELSKTATCEDDSSAHPGNLITYTIFYTNTGISPAPGVVITDCVQPAYTTDFTFTSAFTKNKYISPCIRFDLDVVEAITPGRSGSISFTVRVNMDVPARTVITNTATIAANLAPPVATEPVTTMVTAPDLALHITVTPTGPVQLGGVLTYTLILTNSGNQSATHVTVTDTLPEGLVYLSGGDRWDGKTVSWIIGTLPITNGQVTFTAWITDGVGGVRNRAYLWSDQRGLQSSNMITAPVLAPVLQVHKTVKPSAMALRNGLLTYTLYYTNIGTLTATGALLLDPLPAGTEYVTSAEGSHITSTDVLSFPLAPVLPEASGAVSFTARVSAPLRTIITNAAQIFYDQFYPSTYISDASLDIPGTGKLYPIGVISDAYNYVAQSFVATAPRLKQAGVYLYGHAEPYPNVRVELWGDASDKPVSSTVLAASGIITDLTSMGHRYFITPRYPTSLVVGARYWLVINGQLGASNGGSAGVRYVTDYPYMDGWLVYSKDEGINWTVWYPAADLDVCIEYIPPPQSNVVSTTIVNGVPYTPSHPIPADGVNDVPTTQMLAWQGGDPDGDPVTYTLAFGDSNPPPVISDTVTISTYDPNRLQLQTTYYWIITATDGVSITGGDVWIFSTTINVSLSGPIAGVVDAPYPFSATLDPISTTSPITYIWQATGNEAITTSASTHTFSWTTPGPQSITVTASNAWGKAIGTHTIFITSSPVTPTNVTIDGPTWGFVGNSHTFTATVSPITTTPPITYVWQAPGQLPRISRSWWWPSNTVTCSV